MKKTEIDKVQECTVEKSTPETEKSDKVESANSDDDGLSQLEDDELLRIRDADVEGLNDETVGETLEKEDQVEGVRENSAVEPSGEDVGDVKETERAGVPRNEVPVENSEVETSRCLSTLPDPSVVKPSLSLDPSAAQGLSPVSVPSKEEQRSDPRVVNSLAVSPVLRTPARDGYNWRKYGQKQVKSPKGSRSYYRCTYSECCAKKIECSNDSGNVVEIVNKGLHSHEPPRKISFSPREIRTASATATRPVAEDNTVVKEPPAIVHSGSDRSTSTKENTFESQTIAERKRHCENEAVEGPDPKRRLPKDNSQSSDTVSEPGKKHKFVVHADGDVGISGDGYGWRKYGQKMVKGNPNPRNYYRCTSAGCPVRKHIETSAENKTAVIITYKGVHNHDMPVPKKRHGPPSSILMAAAAPTSMRNMPDDQVNIPTSTQCSVGRESEKQSSEALDVVGG